MWLVFICANNLYNALLYITVAVHVSEFVTLENQNPILGNGEIFENFFFPQSMSLFNDNCPQ